MEVERLNLIGTTAEDLQARTEELRRYLDYDQKERRLEEVNQALEDPSIWSDQERAQQLSKEKKRLEDVVLTIKHLTTGLSDALELFEMAKEEDDDASLEAVEADINNLKKEVEHLEFQRMFNQEHDEANCFLEIQAGAGGTEAQDWASMLERMYIKFAERQSFKPEIVEETEGDVAGIKGCTIKITGDYAYGWLRTETGIHRLVRKSPFDSNARRHTSFASVFVVPEVDDSFEIEVNPADLRIDTFRASGAGGQHIQKTESAVRITHLPTGIVVECQDERSQHKNKERAMGVLISRIHAAQVAEVQAKESSMRKSLIGSGDRSERIRTYNYPQGRVTDHRINLTLYKLDSIMDGDLDCLISPLTTEHQAEQLAALAEGE
ncbi:peptide chain release factor 2 [Parasutterella excrementihominis]|uniref:peptide chain release factor 2 n=1 Tax=Parasutterella excrementihominis TaxID=487175 RepID=UPI00241D1388|nr:peptide chain release factor 2 [Parasutterella excrementihominis]